jgi:hypothetical protein
VGAGVPYRLVESDDLVADDGMIPPLVHLRILIDEHRQWTRDMFEQRDLRYQQRFDAQTSAIDAALLAAKEAVTKAEISTERRFDSVNEFRETLSDQAGEFVTRAEFDAVRSAAEERLRDITTRMDKAEGKSTGYGALYGWALAGISAIVSIVVIMNILFGK